MGGGNREWVTTAVLLLLALLTVYIQFALWPMPMTGGFDYRDSGVFAHGGWVIAHGGMPYLDFWDQKPPSIFLLNALAIKLGGSLTAVWWLSLITALLALEQGYKALRMIAGRRYALAGAAIAVVSLMGTMRGGNMVELYALPLRWWLFAMTLKLLEWRSGSMPHRQMKIVGLTIAMGIATGILLALRQNEAVATLALFIGLAWTLLLELRWREFWNILHGGTIGFSIVLGSLTIWLAGGGALDACIDQTFYYNFVHKIAATFMMRLDAFGAIFDFLPVFGFAVLGWWWVTISFLRKREWAASPLFRILMVWLPFEVLSTLSSGQRFPHYFISLIPVVTILVVVLLEKIDLASVNRPRRRQLIWVLFSVLLVVNVLKFDDSLLPPFGSKRAVMERRAADWIRENTPVKSKITIWGMVPELYVMANREPATRMTHVYPLLSPGYTTHALVNDWTREMAINRPLIVVDASSHNGRVPTLADWQAALNGDERPLEPTLESFYTEFHDNYTPIDTLAPWQWVMYKRKDAEASWEQVQ